MDRVLAVDEAGATAEHQVCAATAVEGALWEPLLLEGLAQTAAVLNGANETGESDRPRKGMLVGARGLRIDRIPLVGETVRYQVQLTKRLGPLTLIEGTARVGDETVAQGSMKFYVEES